MLRQTLRTAAIAGAFVCAAASQAGAVLIDFESDAVGAKANGFVSNDSALVSFTDTLGANLQVNDFLAQSNGNGLGVFGDDASRLQMDFVGSATNLVVNFGNDDPSFADPGDKAFLQGFLGGFLVGAVDVVLNRDDIINQSLTLGGLEIDQAIFFYGDAAGNAIDLIEIVDDISFDAGAAVVPLPAALPLMAAGVGAFGFIGWRRRRAA